MPREVSACAWVCVCCQTFFGAHTYEPKVSKSDLSALLCHQDVVIVQWRGQRGPKPKDPKDPKVYPRMIWNSMNNKYAYRALRGSLFRFCTWWCPYMFPDTWQFAGNLLSQECWNQQLGWYRQQIRISQGQVQPRVIVSCSSKASIHWRAQMIKISSPCQLPLQNPGARAPEKLFFITPFSCLGNWLSDSIGFWFLVSDSLEGLFEGYGLNIIEMVVLIL